MRTHQREPETPPPGDHSGGDFASLLFAPASVRRPFAAGFAVLLACGAGAAGCSSVAREPATARPLVDEEAASEAAGRTGGEAAEASGSGPGGLTQDEILAMPPGGVDSESLDPASRDPLSMDLAALNASGVLRDVRFHFDSAELDAEARETLDRNAAWLNRYPSVRILIEGHCDERGTVEYNLALGDERARAVRDYLGRLGVGEGRMQTISYGKEFPLDPDQNEQAWERNRRAHLEIVAR